jgi:hypothetical protein
MNRFIAAAIAAVTICVLAAASIQIGHASPQAGGDASPIFGIKLPVGFRDQLVYTMASRVIHSDPEIMALWAECPSLSVSGCR